MLPSCIQKKKGAVKKVKEKKRAYVSKKEET